MTRDMTRVVVFGYHEVGARCLRVLLDARQSLGLEVPLVVTHQDDPKETVFFSSVSALAQQHGLNVITPANANDPTLLAQLQALQPDFIFSPYHDVRLPHGIPSAMMVHDTCLSDMGHLYPWQVRAYYRAMLNVNLGRARHVLTVSESSRACILARYRLPSERVKVVPNTLEPDFLESSDDPAQIAAIEIGRPRIEPELSISRVTTVSRKSMSRSIL